MPKLTFQFIVISSLIILISGCSYIPWFGDDEEVQIDLREPAELTEFVPEVRLQQNWQVSLGGDAENTRIHLYPHAYSDKIAFTGYAGKLGVFNTTNGRSVYSIDAFESISAGVGGNEQYLVVGTLDGDVAAYLAADAKEVWKVNVGSEVIAIAQQQNELAILRTNDNRIIALSISSGERLWTVTQTSPALTVRGTGELLVSDGTVYAGMDNGKVIAVSTDSGNVVWEARVSVPSGRSELERLVDVDGQLAIDEEYIYAASYHGRVVAISRINGRIIWARDIASISGVSSDDIFVYVADRDDNVWALEKASGVSVWKQEKLLYRELSAPVILGDTVLVGDGQGYLHALAKEDGRIIGRTNLAKKPIHTSSLSNNSAAYVMDNNGRLASYSVVGLN